MRCHLSIPTAINFVHLFMLWGRLDEKLCPQSAPSPIELFGHTTIVTIYARWRHGFHVNCIALWRFKLCCHIWYNTVTSRVCRLQLIVTFWFDPSRTQFLVFRSVCVCESWIMPSVNYLPSVYQYVFHRYYPECVWFPSCIARKYASCSSSCIGCACRWDGGRTTWSDRSRAVPLCVWHPILLVSYAIALASSSLIAMPTAIGCAPATIPVIVIAYHQPIIALRPLSVFSFVDVRTFLAKRKTRGLFCFCFPALKRAVWLLFTNFLDKSETSVWVW